MLVEAGFIQGSLSCEPKNIRILVHRDDFMVLGAV
jgi:hypothetical protein